MISESLPWKKKKMDGYKTITEVGKTGRKAGWGQGWEEVEAGVSFWSRKLEMLVKKIRRHRQLSSRRLHRTHPKVKYVWAEDVNYREVAAEQRSMGRASLGKLKRRTRMRGSKAIGRSQDGGSVGPRSQAFLERRKGRQGEKPLRGHQDKNASQPWPSGVKVCGRCRNKCLI